ncbi:MAG: signal peptidase II [Oscillospiraceae bacterium]
MILTFLSVGVLVALDQISKYLATVYLQPVGTLPFIPGIMDLNYILNDGMAFSMFSGNKFLLIGVTSVALIALALYLIIKKPSDKLEFISLVLILSGGIGNLIDRILNGYVVDFFNFTFVNFAVFNVADCFVTCGAVLLVITFIMQELKERKTKAANNENK